jgi:5-methylcytosine-specific restriction endonuclease McrA
MQVKNILNSNVLVLNSGWSPVNVTVVKDVAGLMVKGVASVVVHENMVSRVNGESDPTAFQYEELDFNRWIEVSALIDQKRYKFIHSAKHAFFVPSVVKVNTFSGNASYHIKLSRKSVYNRDKGKCQYCNKSVDRRDFTIDHIHPKSRGGGTTWNNIVTACKPCNARKDDKTLKQARMTLLSKPIKPGVSNFQEIYKDEYEHWSDFINTR